MISGLDRESHTIHTIKGSEGTMEEPTSTTSTEEGTLPQTSGETAVDQMSSDIKFIMKCLKCPAEYWYRQYPVVPTCWNCGSKVVEIRDVR